MERGKKPLELQEMDVPALQGRNFVVPGWAGRRPLAPETSRTEEVPYLRIHSLVLSYIDKAGDVLGRNVEGSARGTVVMVFAGIGVGPGFSGAPVLYSETDYREDDAKLVAMLVGGKPRKAGDNGSWCWGIPVNTIIEVIRKGVKSDYPPKHWPNLDSGYLPRLSY